MEGHVGPGKDFFNYFQNFILSVIRSQLLEGRELENPIIYILKDYPGCCIENYMGQKNIYGHQ